MVISQEPARCRGVCRELENVAAPYLVESCRLVAN